MDNTVNISYIYKNDLFLHQIKGYYGAVFCPDRRLCLYPDVTPPLDDVRTLLACIRW